MSKIAMEVLDELINEDKTKFNEIDKLLSQTIQYSIAINSDYAQYIDKAKYLSYINAVQSLEATGSTGNIKDFKHWVKTEVKELATNGVVGFTRTCDKLFNYIGTFSKKLKIKWKLSRITPEKLDKVFDDLKLNIKTAREYGNYIVHAVPYEIAYKRLESFSDIIQYIIKLAENADENAFESDRTWEQFASMSNNCMKAVPPNDGSFFRQLEWINPYRKDIDLLKTEWGDPSKLDDFKKLIFDTKTNIFGELENALKYLKKLVKDLEGEVSHTRNDNYDAQVVKYARGYVATKFVYQLQDIFIKEIMFDITAIPKMLKKTKSGSNKNEDVANAVKDSEEKNVNENRKNDLNEDNKDSEDTELDHDNDQGNEELFVYDLISEEGLIDRIKGWIDLVKGINKKKREQINKIEYEKVRNDLFVKYGNYLDDLESEKDVVDTIDVPDVKTVIAYFKILSDISQYIIQFNPFKYKSKNALLKELESRFNGKFISIREHKFLELSSKEVKFEGSGYDKRELIDNLKKQMVNADTEYYQLFVAYDAALTKLNGYLDARVWNDNDKKLMSGLVKEYLRWINDIQQKERFLVKETFKIIRIILKS